MTDKEQEPQLVAHFTQENAEKVVGYLAATDLEAARAKSHYDKYKAMSEQFYAVEFERFKSAGLTVELAKVKAKASQSYKDYLDELERLEIEWLTLENKRDTAHVIFSGWQSYNRNVKQGQY